MFNPRQVGKTQFVDAMVKQAAARDAAGVMENQALVKAAVNYHALQEAKRLISEDLKTHSKFASAKALLDQMVLDGSGMAKRADWTDAAAPVGIGAGIGGAATALGLFPSSMAYELKAGKAARELAGRKVLQLEKARGLIEFADRRGERPGIDVHRPVSRYKVQNALSNAESQMANLKRLQVKNALRNSFRWVGTHPLLPMGLGLGALAGLGYYGANLPEGTDMSQPIKTASLQRGLLKRANTDPAREIDERAQAQATIDSNSWLWDMLNQHPVESTISGLGALLAAQGMSNIEYNRLLGNPSATTQQALANALRVNVPRDLYDYAANGAAQRGILGEINRVNPFVLSELAANLGHTQPALASANTSKELQTATKTFEEAIANARQATGNRLGVAGAALGAGALGYWDWNRGQDSILRDVFGQHKAAVDILMDRDPGTPYINPYRAAAIGAGLGAGAAALGKAIAEGGLPSLPNVALGAFTGAGLGAVGANVYNNMTTNYLAGPVINPQDALRI